MAAKRFSPCADLLGAGRRPVRPQQAMDTPCGPVAVFDGAVYFVEGGRVARWADGATTP